MSELYQFADFEVDLRTFSLRRAGQTVAIEPLVFDLLVALLRHAGQLRTKENLIQDVWAGRHVSDSTISTAVKFARKALGDSGEEQRFIKTIRGRGFRFVGAVDDRDVQIQDMKPAISALRPILRISPVLAVTSGHAPLASKIIEARLRPILARIPILQIAAPSDTEGAEAAQFILDIQLIDMPDGMLAECVLSECKHGTQIWARSVEALSDPPLWRELTHAIVARLEPAILAAMCSEMRALNRPAAEPLLLQAIGLLSEKGWHKSTFEEADALLKQAIAINPAEPLAHAYLALLTALGHRVGILRDTDGLVAAAIKAADRALALDGQSSTILGVAGCALADVGALDRALPLLTKAVDADPNNGQAKTALGSAYLLSRRYDEAIDALEEGIEISPADSRLGVWGSVLALAHLAGRQTDKARTAAQAACAEDDALYMPRLALAAVELADENPDAAKAAIKECLRTRPELHEIEVRDLLGAQLGGGVWQIVERLAPR